MLWNTVVFVKNTKAALLEQIEGPLVQDLPSTIQTPHPSSFVCLHGISGIYTVYPVLWLVSAKGRLLLHGEVPLSYFNLPKHYCSDKGCLKQHWEATHLAISMCPADKFILWPCLQEGCATPRICWIICRLQQF